MTEGTFQRGRITLTWSEGHDLHGLQVQCRRRPLGEVLDVWLRDDDDGRPWSALSTAEKVDRAKANAESFAAVIVGWNLADDDGAVVPWPPVDPATGGAVVWPPQDDRARAIAGAVLMRHCDDDMINDMREAYASVTLRVAPPLPQRSPNGPDGQPDPSTTPAPEDWTPAALPVPQELIHHPV